MRRLILLAWVALAGGLALATDEASFRQLLEPLSLTFTAPAGFEPIAPPAGCDYALKGTTGELRYAIRSLASQVEAYQKSQEPGSQTVAADPNKLYSTMLLAMGANLAGVSPDRIPNQAFSPPNVKAEFGADAGMTSAVPLGDGRLCLLNVYHKDNVADAFVYYIAADMETLKGLINTPAVFQALRFK